MYIIYIFRIILLRSILYATTLKIVPGTFKFGYGNTHTTNRTRNVLVR